MKAQNRSVVEEEELEGHLEGQFEHFENDQGHCLPEDVDQWIETSPAI